MHFASWLGNLHHPVGRDAQESEVPLTASSYLDELQGRITFEFRRLLLAEWSTKGLRPESVSTPCPYPYRNWGLSRIQVRNC